MREFESGATRDTDEGKLDYEGFLSPLVLKRYAQYMHKHRKQADGKLRDSDNWQKGFGDKHLDVCIKSLWRHFLDLWKEHRGLKSREGLDDAIGGILFNLMAYYHKILTDREKNKKYLPSFIVNGVCKIGEDAICNIGYACDACPYNKKGKK